MSSKKAMAKHACASSPRRKSCHSPDIRRQCSVKPKNASVAARDFWFLARRDDAVWQAPHKEEQRSLQRGSARGHPSQENHQGPKRPADTRRFRLDGALGTAWVLGRDRSVYTLNLAAGRVPVSFDASGVAWMQPPPVTLGDALPIKLAAALFGLAEEDIDQSLPCRYAEVGPRFVLVGVETIDDLRRARVDATIHAGIAKDAFLGVFAFAQQGYSRDAHFAVRMFFNANGWREDPATGSANAAFAAYLRERGVTGAFVVEQGFEIARPSRVYLNVGDMIRVGGKVRPVLTGDLLID